MTVIALIPALVVFVMLFRWPLPRVFLAVFLPLYLCVPGYFYWKVPLLPPITVTDGVLLPMGIAVIAREWRHYRFSRMDLMVVIFIVSLGVADILAGRRTVGIFGFFIGFTQVLFPYLLGKLLIEGEDLRIPTLRRFVVILALVTVPSLWEYRMGNNPFLTSFGKLFPTEPFPWKTQIRWGFGRLSGPFAQSELAGMVFFFGLIMAVWLLWAAPDNRPVRWLKRFHITIRHSKLWVVLLAVALASTQARGPWLGFALALPVALMGRSRNHLRYLTLALLITVPIASAGYAYTKIYLADGPPQTQEQENAQYRGRLLTNYVPVAKDGHLWGWGAAVPVIEGQDSIDNEYLLVWLHQGAVGAIAFIAICCEGLFGFFWTAIRSPGARSRSFAYSLLGVFAGILLTISTVYLGTQTYSLFFFLAGWSQTLKQPVPVEQPKFEYVLA